MAHSLFCVKVSPQTSPIIQSILFEKGYKWVGIENTVQNTDKQYLFPWDDMTICHCNDTNGRIELSLKEFATWVVTDKLPARKEVKLNREYTAIITRNGVAVGCQNFSREKSLELANAIIEAMKDD